MARTSKKERIGQIPVSRRFHVGIYARLSVDSTEKKNESIDTQIAIARQYLKEHPEMELYGCYTDLGKTGTNFKREGFERMMQDVRKKRIDCVIVKDLSRFGRNHIEMGNYIQKIFPFMGIRFIAITDGVDTLSTKAGTDEMAVNLKNLFNEMYAKDISGKVKSSRRTSQEQGSYTGGIPPYGYYPEWVAGKKCLFVCPETSVVVKEIYEMFLAGKNMRQITRVLYEKKIHRPGIYRKTGHVYQQKGEVLEQWAAGTVKLILSNPVYMGCLVHGTTEPVVSEDMFFQTASILEKSAVKYCNRNRLSKNMPLEEDIYAGVLFCGGCGKRMARVVSTKQLNSGDRVRIYGYYCPASRRMDDLHCPANSISINVLAKLVKTALHQEFALSGICPGKLVKEFEKQAEGQKRQAMQEIARCGKQKENMKKRGSELYLKYHTGSISLEKFQQMKRENEKSVQEISKRQEALQCSLYIIDKELKEKGKFLRNLIKCNEKTELAKDVIHTLVNRIDVYTGSRVKITFTFRMNDLLVKR